MQKILFTIAAILLISMSLSAQDTPTIKWSGQVFGDYYYNVQRDTSFNTKAPATAASSGAKVLNGFQFRRIDISADASITKNLSARVRLENDNTEVQTDSKLGFFLKDAWIKYKDLFDGSDLVIGIQPTLAYEVSEAAWGHRYIEKTILDLHGTISSRDFGIALKGKIDNDGMFKYGVMYGNNSGNKLETDKFKRLTANIQFTPIKNFTFNFDLDYRQAAPISDKSSSVTPQPVISNDGLTYSLFAGYNDDCCRFGIEAYLNSTSNGDYIATAKSYSAKQGFGGTIYGEYMFLKDLGLFARYDHYDIDVSNVTNFDATDYTIVGIDWIIDSKLTISPNVLLESYKVTPTYRTFTSSVTPRVTFYYNF